MGRNRPKKMEESEREKGSKAQKRDDGETVAKRSSPNAGISSEVCQLSPLAGFGPRFLRVPALQPFGKKAGGGAPHPDTPYRGTRASCPHWRVSGPKCLGAPALQPFGKEAGGGALSPETPYRGTRSSVASGRPSGWTEQ